MSKMKKEQKTKLMKKGWSDEEIKKAEEITEAREKRDKSKSIVHSNRLLFWGMLFVMVVGNALVALVLIPIMIVLTKFTADIFVFIIGFFLGLWFNFLVWDIEHLTRKHHLIAVLIIPALAILDLYAMVRISNAINQVFTITSIREDPLTISTIYVIAFLLPYLWTVLVKKKIKRY